MFAALAHRDFRLYWSGFVTSVSGMQMFIVVQAWLIFDLTGSPFHLGLIGLARAAPAVVLGLVGGVIADRLDQRKLLMATTSITAVLYLVLATLTIMGVVQVWHILTNVFLVAALQSFDQPSRQAIFPNLIDRKDLMKAVGLNSTVHPGTRIIAPLIAGYMIDQTWGGAPHFGAAIAIYVVAVTYLAFTYLLFRVHLPPIQRAGGRSGLQDLKDGIQYIRTTNLFRLLIGMSFVHAFFGMAHVTLLPVFAEKLLGDATGSGLGFLFSAAGAGGLMGAFIGGSLGHIHHRGWLIIGGGGMFGVSLALFAFSPFYLLSVGLEWLASISNQLFMVTAQTSMHSQVPNEYRGRVMGVWGLTHTLVQPSGGLAMGGAASGIGAPAVVAAGGSVILLFAALVVGRSPHVRNLGAARHPETVSA